MIIPIIMLCGAALYILAFFIYDTVKTNYHLSKNQQEWDELKAKAVERDPNISKYDLVSLYIDFCKEKESYFPHF